MNFESSQKSVTAESRLTVNELKEVFFSLKINEGPRYADISFNADKNCFGLLLKLLMAIFNLSFQKFVFQKSLKLLKIHQHLKLTM